MGGEINSSVVFSQNNCFEFAIFLFRDTNIRLIHAIYFTLVWSTSYFKDLTLKKHEIKLSKINVVSTKMLDLGFVNLFSKLDMYDKIQANLGRLYVYPFIRLCGFTAYVAL